MYITHFIVCSLHALQWRHNDHDGVSNHQPHGYLLNRLFRRRSKKTSKLRVTGVCVGNSPGPVNCPHKGPVTRKMFSFDNVIMRGITNRIPFIITSWNGNIFRVNSPLCGELTGHGWIPLTKTSDAELWCFLWYAPEQTVKWTIMTPVIWDAIKLIMTSL